MRDGKLHTKYADVMTQLLDKKYAEEVPQDCKPDSGNVWYLPHHPVMTDKKPDKVRIVLDCASKCQGVSLNDVVLQGPDLTNNLLRVLVRFRQQPVALMVDIERMFHQVRVPLTERDVMRFCGSQEVHGKDRYGQQEK